MGVNIKEVYNQYPNRIGSISINYDTLAMGVKFSIDSEKDADIFEDLFFHYVMNGICGHSYSSNSWRELIRNEINRFNFKINKDGYMILFRNINYYPELGIKIFKHDYEVLEYEQKINKIIKEQSLQVLKYK